MRLTNRPQGLRLKMLLLVFVSTIPAFFYLLYNAEQLRREREAEATGHALRVTRLIAQYQVALVQNTSDLLRAITQAPSIARGDWALCNGYLQRVLADNPRYSNLGVADATGQVVCTAIPHHVPLSIGDSDHFQQAMATGRDAIGTFVIDRPSGEKSIGIGHPLLDADGRVRLVAYAALKAEALTPQVGDIALGPRTTLQVFDGQGTLLARLPPGEARIGQPIEPQALFDATRLANSGSLWQQENQRHRYTYASVSVGGVQEIGVAMAAPIDELLIHMEQRHWGDLFGVLVMMGAVLVVGWLSARTVMLHQTQGLTRAIRNIAQGAPVVPTRDGFGLGVDPELATEFDAMARQVGGRIERLQQTAATLEHQKALLAMVAEGQPRDAVLQPLVQWLEMQMGDAICALALFDQASARLRHGLAPHLPPAVLAELDGLPTGPDAEAYAAATGGADLVVDDIDTAPAWQRFRVVAQAYGLRACWSQPLRDADGTVLGVLAVYFHEPRAPREAEAALLRDAAAIAVAAIRAEQRRSRGGQQPGSTALVFQCQCQTSARRH